jgi:hypothetical protein
MIADALGLISLSENSENTENSDDGYESEDGPSTIMPFKKPEADVSQWVESLHNTHDGTDYHEITSSDSHHEMDIQELQMLPSPQPVDRDEVPTNFNEYEGINLNSAEITNVVRYQDFVKRSAAYHWLLSMIQESWRLGNPGTSNAMSDISKSIASRILSQPTARKVSRRSTPVTIEMRVSLDWDLRAFIKEQQYDVLRPDDVLDRAICLTGTWREAHAITPLQYLRQTWPLTFMPVYELMKKFLSLETDTCDCKFCFIIGVVPISLT